MRGHIDGEHTDDSQAQNGRPRYMPVSTEDMDGIDVRSHKTPDIHLLSLDKSASESHSDAIQPRKQRLFGWRKGIIICGCLAALIGLINLIFTIWASVKFPQSNGISTAFEGTCDAVDKHAIWIHLLINILSAVLLSSSNYALHCLSAPTRLDLDRAHRKHQWLHVGLNSLYNMQGISSLRVILWVVLTLSSLPIHLLYNSVMFKVLYNNQYDALVVNPAFLQASNAAHFLTPSTTLGYEPNSACSLTINSATGTGPYDLKNLSSLCHITDCTSLSYYADVTTNFTTDDLVDACGAARCPIQYANGSILEDANVHDDYGPPTWTALAACPFADCHATSNGSATNYNTFPDIVEACFDPVSLHSIWWNDAVSMQSNYLANQASFENLPLDKCLAVFGNDLVFDYSQVLFVTKETAANEAAAYMYYNQSALTVGWTHDWLCNDQNRGFLGDAICSMAEVRNDLDSYTLGTKQIDYCLAQTQSDGHCKLQFSITILAVVIAAIAVKAVIIASLIFLVRDQPMVVIGDAVASYLEEQDALTADRCLFAKRDVQALHEKVANSRRISDGNTPAAAPVQYQARRPSRWFKASSKVDLVCMILLAIVAVALSSSGLKSATAAVQATLGSQQSPWTLGFGATTSELLTDQSNTARPHGNDILGVVLQSNLPQLAASLLYVFCNGYLTSMLLAHEWSSYAQKRKPLRTSTPRGLQRSTYWLSLPFRYSIPLLIASSLLHWLVSEAIFPVQISNVRLSVTDLAESASSTSYTAANILAIGYSPLPILLSLLVVILVVVGICSLSARRLSSNMPIASTNSIAIAAACFRPMQDEDASLLAVQWGEIAGIGTQEVGHCAFSSLEVREPVAGRFYAGQ